jgi:hypothetical protein
MADEQHADDTAPVEPVGRDPEDPWADADRPDDADATSVLPAPPTPGPVPLDRTAVMPPSKDVWTGRAGVPEAEVGDAAPLEPGYPAEAGYRPSGSRTWWAPVLIGLVALVLLALIGFGFWLALHGTGTGTEPVPAATTPTPAAPTSAAASPSSSPSPSVSASPSAATFLLPSSLIGKTQAEATAILDEAHLVTKIQSRPDSATPGTVIDVVPAVNTQVSAGQTVTLVVAAPLPSSPAPSPSAVSPSTSPSP